MDFVDNKSRYLHTYLVEPNLCFASLFRPVSVNGGDRGGSGVEGGWWICAHDGVARQLKRLLSTVLRRS